ncbi:uncharacterized protein LOC134780428 [Penaeus indicus]|uniref:uncharacterized protein LOC134780428 n=1 Tax=Penaeus indicus TaxID=29960 RepID=UPI00300D0EA5
MTSCSQTGAKRRALHSFGVHWRGREGDSDDWAAQHLHVLCPGLRPGEVTPASLYSVGLTREAAVTGYKSMLDWRRVGRHGLPPTVGGIFVSQWSATARLKLGSPQPVSWNVRTMCPGISVDLEQVKDSRKTAIIDREHTRLNVSIAALQETRLPSSGSLREENYTFFWKGKEPDEPRIHGVGFAVKNSLLKSVEPPTGGTERILSLCLATAAGTVNIFSIYAPTLSSSEDVKNRFYDELDTHIGRIPPSEPLLLLGDLNARIGSDHQSWPSCIGHHGVGKMNDNGQRLLELCSYHRLRVTNTYFQSKLQHRVSWKHPRSHRWHQLDLIITRRSSLSTVLETRSYHSADCDTDHTLVCSKVRIQPRKLHRSKAKGRLCINVAKTGNPDCKQEFVATIEQTLQDLTEHDAAARWNKIREAVYNASISAFGKRERKNHDWFNTNLSTMEPVIEAKRKALLAYKNSPSERTLTALRTARNNAQRVARRCANDYWLKLCEDIQRSADSGNVRGMFDGIKKAVGPEVKKTAPLKSATGEIITDREQQMKRWVEHYSELYSRETVVTDAALDATDDLPVMEELDQVPTLDELSKAIDMLPSGKAPGSDSIPAQVIKGGKPALLQPLYDLLCLCWKEGAVPQDMRDASIVTLFKNKGDRSDCNNYRGISLLSIVRKMFARILLTRLQKLAARVYPESQCGFRAGRSTTDIIFSVRQLQEECREQGRPLYLAFIDLTKAFDLVESNKAVCSHRHIFFSMLLKYAFSSSEDGVYLHTRSDRKLFNPAHLRAKTKVSEICIREMLFADDAALASHTEEALQRLMDRFAHACNEFGLTISLKKTNISAQDASHAPSISIGDFTLEVVEDFTYLGSTISTSLSLDTEINRWIGKAAATMAKLSKRVWDNKMLTENTKMRIYQACVLSTLLYGSETWTTYMRHERRLNTFHLRCLKRIRGITWQDRIPHSDILTRAGISSVFALLSQRRLRWLGHVWRMEDGRIPKDLLYGQLATGTRRPGRPTLRFKDVCKRDMKACNIKPEVWEPAADDRDHWRQAVHRGSRLADEARFQQAAEKRSRRKERAASASSVLSGFICTNCNRDCHSRIGLHSHSRRCSQP